MIDPIKLYPHMMTLESRAKIFFREVGRTLELSARIVGWTVRTSLAWSGISLILIGGISSYHLYEVNVMHRDGFAFFLPILGGPDGKPQATVEEELQQMNKDLKKGKWPS